MTNIMDTFINIPKQKEAEFWNIDKIGHIRYLSNYGKPFKIFSEDDTLRILDRIKFKNHGNNLNDSPMADTSVDFMGLKMSVPIYLGDMSFGALSGNPNIAIANAADITKTLAGTGEGGLLPEIKNLKRIFVQWASARFGVDYYTINSGSGVVIKIGQGAKPGIGGHLPGTKVTDKISQARRIPENVEAISPAPHHDIYSIEDLSQRIEALKILTKKPVFVKVAATNYIPFIVTGIARSGASGVIIDGQGAGTGATPEVIRDNLGIPIETAVASSHDILIKEHLRDNFKIIAAGRVANSTDAAKLYALGADMVSMGTGILIAMGCVMVKKCNLGYCPTALTNKLGTSKIFDIDFGVNNIVNFIKGFRLELANILENLNLSSINELIGRKDLLYSDGISNNTSKVLNINSVNASNTHYKQSEFSYSTRYLNELINKGEIPITSMGSNAPPDVSIPSRIIDWLRIDGAQVTRPSIDPYRENIDTGFYLADGKIRLSMPVIFDISSSSDEIKDAISWASQFTGTIVINNKKSEKYGKITVTKHNGTYKWNDIRYSVDHSKDNVSGYIIEDASFNELYISELDEKLKGEGHRYERDIIPVIENFKNSGDIIKYIALGADSIILPSKIFEIGLGNNHSNLNLKALNLLLTIKKEIALIAGAMGISNVQYSLSGNRELLRGINLDNDVENVLGVTEAGSI